MCAYLSAEVIGVNGCQGSRHAGLRVLVEKARSSDVGDERVVGEPLDRAAMGTGGAEGVPRRQQLRKLLVQLGFEPAEGAFAIGWRPSRPGAVRPDVR